MAGSSAMIGIFIMLIMFAGMGIFLYLYLNTNTFKNEGDACKPSGTDLI